MIIHVLTTSAAERDIQRTLGIEAALTRQGLPPAQHLVDAGYVGADELTQSQLQYGIELVGPIQSDGQWQAKSGEGYDVSRFVIDWDAHQASCPQGKRSWQWVEHQRAGRPLISIKFAPRDCRACPVRAHCTKAQGRGRTITVRSPFTPDVNMRWRNRRASAKPRPSSNDTMPIVPISKGHSLKELASPTFARRVMWGNRKSICNTLPQPQRSICCGSMPGHVRSPSHEHASRGSRA